MTIILGYVPTPEGRAALEQAIDECRLRGSDLLVISSHVGGDQLEGGRAAQIETDLEKVGRTLTSRAITHEILLLVRGSDPAADIIRVAQERNAELIVMGLRKRNPVGKLILGSHAIRLLHDAPCPVLAVRSYRPSSVKQSSEQPR